MICADSKGPGTYVLSYKPSAWNNSRGIWLFPVTITVSAFPISSPPVSDQPEVELIRWAAYELPYANSRHFVG